MANVAWRDPDLAPDGFAPLSANGAYRACDHLVAATVSNWGGTALEAAAAALFPAARAPDAADAVAVEAAVLAAIMRGPCGAVDGKYADRPDSVDGLPFDPVHRDFYAHLWGLAEAPNGTEE